MRADHYQQFDTQYFDVALFDQLFVPFVQIHLFDLRQ